MPMHRMVVIALGAVVWLNLQPEVTWAAADQTSITAPDASILTRTSPAELVMEGTPTLKERRALSNFLPPHQQRRSSLTMDGHAVVVSHGLESSALREDDPMIWQHPIPSVIPLSSALILRELGDEPTGPTTPTAAQVLSDDDLAVVAGVRLRF